MSAGNLHRLSGALAELATRALEGPCSIGACDLPAAGYVQGVSNRPGGVCARHAVDAVRLGFTVYREAPTTRAKALPDPPGGDAA